ncbi:MAG TPA: hypothetical protein VK158_05960 [Acidobacteriota bacterium]|nr:hypothetical protein [Acidobacteriota bacterium]
MFPPKKYIHYADLDRYGRAQVWISYTLRFLMLALTVYSGITGKFISAFAVGLFLIFTFIPAIIEHNYKIILPIEVDFAATVFVFLSLVMGDVRGYYDRFWWWDIVLHSFSGLLLGLVGFAIVYVLVTYASPHRIGPILTSIFSFCFAVTIGAIWELIEFAVGATTHYVMQHGLADTMGDILADCIGALIAAALIYGFLVEKMKWRFISRITRKLAAQSK